MYKFKAIKPAPVNASLVSNYIRQESKAFAEDQIKPEFEHVTDGWTGERPEWKLLYRAGGTWFQVGVEVTDPESKGAKKWKWLDEGTRPHHIPKQPKPGRSLVFMSEYTAGSRPGSLSTGNASSGGELVFVSQEKGVDHPGNAARNWSKLLQERLQPRFSNFGEALMLEISKMLEV